MLNENTKKLILSVIFTLWISLPVPSYANTSLNNETVKMVDIGVLSIRGYEATQKQWQPLIEWLNTEIPQVKFKLHPLTLEQIFSRVERQTLDFVVTNSGQLVLLSRQFPLSWMATMKSRVAGGSTLSIGSTLVVRADSSYSKLDDLEGKKIAAVGESAFGGYTVMLAQWKKEGINLSNYIDNIEFMGFPHDNLIYQLRDHTVEAAIAPICLIEKMAEEGLIDAGQLRVIHNQTPSGFGCQVSTSLYPNWSFAQTGRASPQLAKVITQALFALPEQHVAAKANHSTGWTTPISQLQIDRLFKELNLHPMQSYWWELIFTWFKGNLHWAGLLLLSIALLNAYHFWLEVKFRKNQKLLIETQKKLNEKITMLEHSQRVTIVGELGSSIAHEINQPLSAIRNYSQGGMLRIDKGATGHDVRYVLEKIQSQVIRADLIIRRLRALIKKREIKKQYCLASELVADISQLLAYEFERLTVNFTISQSGEERPLLLDKVGFQQLLLNLLKNGIEACCDNSDFKLLEIHLGFKIDQLQITVTDNGHGLKASAQVLQSAFETTKEKGLGLGLAICNDVVESHCGELSMTNITPQGCRVTVILPYIEESV